MFLVRSWRLWSTLATSSVTDVFLVDLHTGTPGAAKKVNLAWPAGATQGTYSFLFSPDSHWFVYEGDQYTKAKNEVAAVDLSTARRAARCA